MKTLSYIIQWPENIITLFSLLITLDAAYGFKKNKYLNKWTSLILFTIIFAIPFQVFDVFFDEFNLYLIMLIGCGLVYAILFVNYNLKNVMTSFVSCLFTVIGIKGFIGMLFSLTPSQYVSWTICTLFSSPLYYISIVGICLFYKNHPLKSVSDQPNSY